MKTRILMSALLLATITAVYGCAQQAPKAENSTQAIEQSKALPTTQEKVNYLVNQANAFVSSQNFDQAIETAKYILANLDAESQEAKKIIEKATADLKKMAEEKVQDVKKTLGDFGK